MADAGAPAYQPFAVTLKSDSDLAQAVEILRSFKVNMIIPNTVVISNPVLDVSPYASRKDYADGKTIDMERLAADYGVGLWTLYGALYNTPPQYRCVMAHGKRRFCRHSRRHGTRLENPGG